MSFCDEILENCDEIKFFVIKNSVFVMKLK